MNIPLRILRAEVDALLGGRQRLPSARDLEQQERIRACALRLMSRRGRAALTFTSFALALGYSPAMVGRHYLDLDLILQDLLLRHLQAIAAALGNIPQDASDPAAERRAAYVAFTRSPHGGLTESHEFFLRDAHLLPEDLAPAVQQLHQNLGGMLAGDLGPQALVLLDAPQFSLRTIETFLAHLASALPQAAGPAAPRPPATKPAGHAALPSPAEQPNATIPVFPDLPRAKRPRGPLLN